MMNDTNELLRDHVDVGSVATDTVEDQKSTVRLDRDHPGFSDPEYRARRNQIAHIASAYQPGAQIPDAPYTSEEHGVWRAIWEALEPAHLKHACAEYLECVSRLELPKVRIPQLQEVSDLVESISGFRLEPVAGLVAPRAFLESLSRGVFLSTQYIRHYSTPLYTPEPDVAHEIIGHAVTLANSQLAELNRMVGDAVKRTPESESIDRLARVYWFTIEFGVLREDGQVKAYGTGLLSSAGEMEAMGSAELRRLDLEEASRTAFDTTSFQPVLFCAESFDEMYQTLKDYLSQW